MVCHAAALLRRGPFRELGEKFSSRAICPAVPNEIAQDQKEDREPVRKLHSPVRAEHERIDCVPSARAGVDHVFRSFFSGGYVIRRAMPFPRNRNAK